MRVSPTHRNRINSLSTRKQEELYSRHQHVEKTLPLPPQNINTYHRRNSNIHHRDPVRHIPPNDPQREIRPFIHDRLPASDQQDEDGPCVRAVEEDRAAGDVGVESHRGPKVEQAEEDVEDGDGEDGVDGYVEGGV